jgi:inositol hexakisphosphate/diphosphoinositol-pentakisphosphate kinase
MLHNPHIGLTITLEKLYHLAKDMADCAVPQEYGTTVTEKRSIGTKMCRALLEKIKFDLIIARTDNQSDMRYMINMEYGNDLPITTMGRRIRTRLYFTSESHLHTMLNVLRFGVAEGESVPLSEAGKTICAGAPELCYLTQVVFRLFEDTKRDADDPKRYRVEILFSPGATATPMHMAELDRDSDSTRFDSAPPLVVGRDNLTCHEVEEFLDAIIGEGDPEDDALDVASTSTAMDDWKRRNRAMSGVSSGTYIGMRNVAVGFAV